MQAARASANIKVNFSLLTQFQKERKKSNSTFILFKLLLLHLKLHTAKAQNALPKTTGIIKQEKTGKSINRVLVFLILYNIISLKIFWVNFRN